MAAESMASERRVFSDLSNICEVSQQCAVKSESALVVLSPDQNCQTSAMEDTSDSSDSSMPDVKEALMKCCICSKVFTSLEDMRKHRHYCDEEKKAKKKSSKPFVCDHCHEPYTTRYRLDKHLKEHGNFKHKCIDCGLAFKMKRQLICHQQEVAHGKFKPGSVCFVGKDFVVTLNLTCDSDD